MPDIRYVCLSDMHLGEEDSLLTNLKTASFDTDPSEASPVLMRLVECLRFLISQNGNPAKPALILNGDILELALTTDNQAAMVFERFMELIMPPQGKLFERIIYLPGNHDHHLWESARETQYVNYLMKIKPGEALPVPWHATNIFVENDPDAVPSYFLTRLTQRYKHLKNFVITTAYPNFGLMSEDRRKCVIFHHGHFIESLYQLMSFLRTLLFPDREMPDDVWDIEAENFAWIDFFWSTMGRSGEVGKDVEILYEKLQDEEQLRKFLHDVATNLARRYDLPGWGDAMEAKILKKVFDFLLHKLTGRERSHTDSPLSVDAEKGLWAYVNGPLRKQILVETEGSMPSHVTFIFGHTHKPFEEDMNFKEYPQWVNVYNTGGWVVETVKPEPLHGGAIVLIDEDLNATSLRMYTESDTTEGYVVKVEEAIHPGEDFNPLHERIRELVKPSEDPWMSFSTSAARAVSVRAQNLRARINEKN